MEKIKDFFMDLFLNKGVQVLWAILAIVLGLLIIKLALKIIHKTLSKSKMDKITVSFVLSILKFLAYIILILIVAQIVGIPVTGLVALLSTAGLAVGLALQDSLSNLANGIVIITTKPFHEGDYIKIGDVEGSVKNIRMLTTAIVTTDNKLIVLPNSKIVTSEIVNYNILGRRRVDFTFGVAYESDVKLVRDIIMNVIMSNGKVLLDPAPAVDLKTLNDSSIDFFARCWCDAEDYWDIYYYVTQNVFNEFNKAGISIPYNQVEVRLRDDQVTMPYNSAALPERVEKVRVAKDSGDLFDHILSVGKKRENKKPKEKPTKKDKTRKDEKQTKKKEKKQDKK